MIHQRQALQSLCRESAIWDISCLSPCLCGINLPVIDPFCPWPRICFELWPCHSSREDINVQFHSFLRRIGESSIIWGADNNIYIVICSYTKYRIWITLRVSPRRNHFLSLYVLPETLQTTIKRVRRRACWTSVNIAVSRFTESRKFLS